MPIDCPENREPIEDEVAYLEAYGSRVDAILAICDLDDYPRWRAGELAGLSGGTTKDYEQRQRNWASAAYKKTKSRKQTLPRIAALQQQLRIYRAVGTGKSRSVTRKQLLDRLDFIAIHGEPNHSIAAIKAKEAMQGKQEVSGKQWLQSMVSQFGAERTRRGLEAFGVERLMHIDPGLFEAKSDDTEKRIAALETKDGADHDRKRSAGDLPNDAAGNGARAVSAAATGVERSRNVAAISHPVPDRGRDEPARDRNGDVITDDELRERQREIFGL